MSTHYVIKGKYRNESFEDIDEFRPENFEGETLKERLGKARKEAKRCLAEYYMAYGAGWTLRIVTRRS